MTLLFHPREAVEHRAIAALRCIDGATRIPIDGPLEVEVARSTVRRNRSGLYVIASAAALPGFDAAFPQQPVDPPVGSLSLRAVLRDPSGRYLPRSASIALPRDPAPANAAQPTSLFRPLDLAMYAGSAAPTEVNWSLLRVSVSDGTHGDALGGVLLRVLQGTVVLARGMTDWRGEALVAIPGVPVTTWSDDPGAVVVDAINAQLEVTAETAALQRIAVVDVRAGRAPASLPVSDPDALEAATGPGFHRQAQAVVLRAGRSQVISFPVVLP